MVRKLILKTKDRFSELAQVAIYISAALEISVTEDRLVRIWLHMRDLLQEPPRLNRILNIHDSCNGNHLAERGSVWKIPWRDCWAAECCDTICIRMQMRRLSLRLHTGSVLGLSTLYLDVLTMLPSLPTIAPNRQTHRRFEPAPRKVTSTNTSETNFEHQQVMLPYKNGCLPASRDTKLRP